MQTLVSLIVVVSYIPLMAQKPVSLIAHSESQHSIGVFSPSGEITLPLVRRLLTLNDSSGKSQSIALFVLRDPRTGYYFWRYAEHSVSNDSIAYLAVLAGREAIYTAQDGLYYFKVPALSIFVSRYTNKANSMDVAVHASIEEIKQNLSILGSIGVQKSVIPETLIRSALDDDFGCPPVSPICYYGNSKFVSIDRQDGNWRLLMRNRHDQEIIFDEKYTLVNTRRISRKTDKE